MRRKRKPYKPQYLNVERKTNTYYTDDSVYLVTTKVTRRGWKWR